MLQSILTYTKQRFNPALFSLLTLFLLLYAVGGTAMHRQHLYLLVLLLPVLYMFRLFDDLASREVDSAKDNRIYTFDAPYKQLLLFCAIFTGLLLLLLIAINRQAGSLFFCFFLLNGLAYYFLFNAGQWRYVLPLLKYPFICILMMTLAATEHTLTIEQVLPGLSLLPVFLVFEAFSDPAFRVSDHMIAFLFISAHLLLLPTMQHLTILLAALATVMLFALLLLRQIKGKPYAPYVILLYFLTIRIISSYEF